ncbi:serine hydrolase domain-containing protein [Steroidobacter sp.]|uniref:serine hydrolase domain-containing protein n=1 Tax=Steroidobacter sp. TaxID=1978227 RepID=UPI001A49A136|nr:serine hydrolase [Steroidobacter sp.]MBL8268970.1 serine hydrolase [Steroidobacter sp.]
MSSLSADRDLKSVASLPSSIDAEWVRRAYAGKLLPAQQRHLFSDVHWGFPTRTVRCSGVVQALPQAGTRLSDFPIQSRGVDYDLPDYLSRNCVVGLMVLQHGRVVLESYEQGADATTPWISMSLAKSVSTTLVGAAIRDGCIGNVAEPLTRYLPELRNSAYASVSIRELLQMTSGVRWDDTHTDPSSQRRRMLELQIEQQPGTILRYLASLPRAADPGSVWNYSTGETHVVGALVRAATGAWLADYLSEKIWSRAGMQSEATWWLESPGGLEVAGSGISATLRDYARFGSFLMQESVAGGEQVLPQGWVREATSPRHIAGKRLDYGYMWWPVAAADGSFDDGAFSGRGIFGQFIYVNPRQQVVIAVLSARSKPKWAEAIIDNDFFNSTVAALR